MVEIMCHEITKRNAFMSIYFQFLKFSDFIGHAVVPVQPPHFDGAERLRADAQVGLQLLAPK
jgi:hypothetical protein